LHRKILEAQGVPGPSEESASLLSAGQPFVAEVLEQTEEPYVVRSVHGWIALDAESIEPSAGLWLEPALVARALPGVTRVERVEGDEQCALLSMRVKRGALRRTQDLEVSVRRCAEPQSDGLRWIASSERIVKQKTGESVDLPVRFLNTIDLKLDRRYGWLLGIRRVEWGRRLGPVFARIYSRELRTELARALRHAAPVVTGEVVESTSRIE
jgi:hypothetical protein